jgi:hypothetical protein
MGWLDKHAPVIGDIPPLDVSYTPEQSNLMAAFCLEHFNNFVITELTEDFHTKI